MSKAKTSRNVTYLYVPKVMAPTHPHTTACPEAFFFFLFFFSFRIWYTKPSIVVL